MKKISNRAYVIGKDQTNFLSKIAKSRITKTQKNAEALKARRNSAFNAHEGQRRNPVRPNNLFDIDFSRINTKQSEEDPELQNLLRMFKTVDRPARTRQHSPKRKYEKKKSEGRVVPHVYVRLT